MVAGIVCKRSLYKSILFQYVRLCPTTDLELVWTLLTEHWKLPIPNLLISVTGGAQRFDLNPRLKAVFKRGLINAATTTGIHHNSR